MPRHDERRRVWWTIVRVLVAATPVGVSIHHAATSPPIGPTVPAQIAPKSAVSSGGLAPVGSVAASGASPSTGPIRDYHFTSVRLSASGGQPTWLAYDSGVRSFYVSQNNSTVSVIPAGSLNVAHTIPVGGSPFGVAYDPLDARVFVANSGSNNLSVIADGSNSTVTSIPVGSRPYGVAYDDATGEVFVADGGSNAVTIVDAATLALIGTVPVQTDPVGVACNPWNGYMYVANEASASVSVIDPATDGVVSNVSVETGPYAVAIDNATGVAYVSEAQSGAVTVLNASGTAVLKNISVGGNPEGLVYDWRNRTIWVADGSIWVIVLNTSSDTVEQDLLFDPLGAAYDPDKNEICVTNAANGTFQCLISFPGTSWDVSTINFTESGLPAGTRWAVSIDNAVGIFGFDWQRVGFQLSTTSATIQAQFFGLYGFTFLVGPVSGYAASPTNASFGSYNPWLNVSITFTPAPGHYVAVFVARGLIFEPWSILQWGVNVSNGSKASYSSVTSSLTIGATNGSYSWTPLSIPGYNSPAGGSRFVAGGDIQIDVNYSNARFDLNFTETGLPRGSNWTVVVVNDSRLQSLLTSDTNTITLPEPNGTYLASFSPTLVAGIVYAPPVYLYYLVVNGGPVDHFVNFTLSAIAVQFNETGLNETTSWTIQFGGYGRTGAGNASFDVPNGTYNFTISAVTGFTPHPASGEVIVNGSPVWRAVRFLANASVPPAPLEANFTDHQESAACLAGGGVTFHVVLVAAVTGGTGPDAYLWTLPSATATGNQVNATFSWGGNLTVLLNVTDAEGTTANVSRVLQLQPPPCTTPVSDSGGLGLTPDEWLIVGGALLLLVAAPIGLVLLRRRARGRGGAKPAGEPSSSLGQR